MKTCLINAIKKTKHQNVTQPMKIDEEQNWKRIMKIDININVRKILLKNFQTATTI